MLSNFERMMDVDVEWKITLFLELGQFQRKWFERQYGIGSFSIYKHLPVQIARNI